MRDTKNLLAQNKVAEDELDTYRIDGEIESEDPEIEEDAIHGLRNVPEETIVMHEFVSIYQNNQLKQLDIGTFGGAHK